MLQENEKTKFINYYFKHYINIKLLDLIKFSLQRSMEIIIKTIYVFHQSMQDSFYDFKYSLVH